MLQACNGLLSKLTSLLDRSNEYLEVFGMAIGTKLKNAVLSVIFTAAAAGVSALISLFVRFYTWSRACRERTHPAGCVCCPKNGRTCGRRAVRLLLPAAYRATSAGMPTIYLLSIKIVFCGVNVFWG